MTDYKNLMNQFNSFTQDEKVKAHNIYADYHNDNLYYHIYPMRELDAKTAGIEILDLLYRAFNGLFQTGDDYFAFDECERLISFGSYGRELNKYLAKPDDIVKDAIENWVRYEELFDYSDIEID